MEVSKESPKRIEILDMAKGVAIFLVLWGHCIQYFSSGDDDFYNNFVFKFIYSFHMPLFMIIMGICFTIL